MCTNVWFVKSLLLPWQKYVHICHHCKPKVAFSLLPRPTLFCILSSEYEARKFYEFGVICMTCVVVNGPWNIRLECHKHEGCGQNACSFLLNCNLKPISVMSRTVVEILSYWEICKSADKSIIATWCTCGGLWIKGPGSSPTCSIFCGGNFYMCTYRGSEIQ